MTVAALSPSVEYIENGGTVSFSVPFRFEAPQHLRATRIALDGALTPLTYGVDYSATGGDTDAGGTLTTVAAAAAGVRLLIVRATPLVQAMNYATADTFPADSHERALDNQMLVAQEHAVSIADIAARAVAVPVGAVAPMLDVTGLADGDLIEYRAGAFQRKDGSGYAGQFAAWSGAGELVGAQGSLPDAVPALAEFINSDGASNVQADLDARPTAAALALPTAAGGLGATGGTTVQGEIDSRPALDLSPIVYDIYWRLMRGRGWAPGDPGDGASQKASTFAASAAIGATEIEVASDTFFVDEQLIAYQSTDTEWYTVPIATKSGTTLTLADDGLPAPVAAGGAVGAWFNDYNHPREYGRYAWADDFLRWLPTAKKRELISARRNWNNWLPLGNTAVVTAIGAEAYTNPGANATGLFGANVAATDQFHGCVSIPDYLPQGNYELEIPLNPGNLGGARNSVRVFVEEEFAGGSTLAGPAPAVIVTGIDCIQKVVIPIQKAQASRVRVFIWGQAAGPFEFQVGAIRWYRITAQVADLRSGKWVALGNSWFDSPWFLDRLEQRLPDVDLIRAGVSGNKASDMIARFDADVAAHNPRVVLIEVGTNDWASSVHRGIFASQIQQLIRMTQDIGAQPIVMTPSVGDAATPPQLANSRAYASALEYETPNPIDQHLAAGVFRGDSITVANNKRVRLFTSPVPVNSDVIVDYASWAASVAGLNICMGFTGLLAPDPVAPVAMIDEVAFGATAYEASNLLIPKSDKSLRAYFAVDALNAATGADQQLLHHNLRFRLADLFK